MTERNRKFEVTMHGRIRKKPIRKNKVDKKAAQEAVNASPSVMGTSPVPGISQETWELIMRMIREQAQQPIQIQQPWVIPNQPWNVPSFPQPLNPYLPGTGVEPGITWYSDTGNPNQEIRLNSGTGTINVNNGGPISGSRNESISGSVQGTFVGFLSNSSSLGVTSASHVSPQNSSFTGRGMSSIIEVNREKI